MLGASGLSALGIAALLGGCATSSNAELPDVAWPNGPLTRKPTRPMPDAGAGLPGGVIPRSRWTRAQPVPTLMDRAQPYYRITVHHDGMDAFASTDEEAAARRLERIRVAHRSRNFGDIGYHYLIDPAGRIWQGRPLEWQGAHVKATNQGNLGICMLGNYMIQRPSDTQVAALDRFVATQMQRYRVPVSKVYTHRELGPTVCPGDNLQAYMARTRRAGALSHAYA